MSEEMNKFFFSKLEDEKQAYDLLDSMTTVAHPSAVYGEPITVGERTIITAAEVSVGLGFGFARGGGGGDTASESDADYPEDAEPVSSSASPAQGYGFGGGGGGGGYSAARPVAVISVGPEGVRVEPVVDPTKIVVTFLTVLGSVLMMRRRMTRGGK
ncbi:MAG TPA: spore germination protein GerW family protein [Aggregatilinea sp.]|jgi:uncharacterized spore protein YtfJ|uniref:spore germination protein GerW family protein n=1 Tax=Aggregatilinea sp. TaxID=2806333 RepID=UPI002BB0A921|nr:spore germination protein GerW family protein [Aggregatilinea sp.]HML21772.1 spore germination protein GerW family protein [Aggregatilinea sp.]